MISQWTIVVIDSIGVGALLAGLVLVLVRPRPFRGPTRLLLSTIIAVTLFNEGAKPLAVTLENKGLRPGQVATVYGSAQKTANAGRMAVTVPPEDVAAVHIAAPRP